MSKKPHKFNKPEKTTSVTVENSYRTLSVRLDLNDARRFKSAADNRGFTNQAALVEAVNRLLVEWGESPVADVGSTGKGKGRNTDN